VRIAGLSLVLGITSFFLISSKAATAATPLDEVQVSPDVTVDLDVLLADDEDVVVDDLMGTLALVGLGGLPDPADVDGYHQLPNGDVLFSLDTTLALPGGVLAHPGDVLNYDGIDYSLEFDSVAAGLPESVNVDAVGLVGVRDLLLSLDIMADVNGMTVDDEDVLRFDGATFTLHFDGSAAGVDGALDLDAVHHIEANGHLLISFDGSGSLGTVSFDDEDVLEFDPDAATFAIVYDGSAEHIGWLSADLDATFVVDASSGTVPNGHLVPGVPLLVGRQGPDVVLTWSESCIPNDADYAVYEGAIGDFTSHAPIAAPNDCTTGGVTTVTFPPGPGDRYWIVVPQGSQREGSYGTDSGGEQRPPSAAACQPQFIGVCP
jgi:hypothetical protein